MDRSVKDLGKECEVTLALLERLVERKERRTDRAG